PDRRQQALRRLPWKQMLISPGIVLVLVCRVPMVQLRLAFRQMEIGNLLLALLSFQILLLIRSYKWHRLLAAAGKRNLRMSLRSLFGGFALGLLTPGRLGELGRCIFVREHERAQVAVLTLLDRFLDFWALLTLIGVSLFWVTSEAPAIFGLAVWLTLLPLMAGLPALVLHLFRSGHRWAPFGTHFSSEAAEFQ